MFSAITFLTSTIFKNFAAYSTTTELENIGEIPYLDTNNHTLALVTRVWCLPVCHPHSQTFIFLSASSFAPNWSNFFTCSDLFYKFKKLIGRYDLSFQFRKIITRYRRIGYILNVMRQSACLDFNPIMIDNYAVFFNCTLMGRASDSMMAPT